MIGSLADSHQITLEGSNIPKCNQASPTPTSATASGLKPCWTGEKHRSHWIWCLIWPDLDSLPLSSTVNPSYLFLSIFFDWGSPALGLRPFRSQPGWTIHPSTVKSLSFAVLPTSFPLKLPRPTLVTPKNPCKSFHDVLETVTLPVVLGIRPSHSNFAVARALLLGWCANPQLVDFRILGWLWPQKYLVPLVCCILYWNVL